MLSAWNDVQRLSIDRDELLDFCVGGGEMHGGFWFSEYDDGEITEGPKLLSNGKGGKDYRIYIYIYIYFLRHVLRNHGRTKIIFQPQT